MSATISCSSSCIATTLSNNGNVYKEEDTMKLVNEQLEELAREIQREYLREWRKRNPDKVREYNKRYWRKKALEMLKEQQDA